MNQHDWVRNFISQNQTVLQIGRDLSVVSEHVLMLLINDRLIKKYKENNNLDYDVETLKY